MNTTTANWDSLSFLEKRAAWKLAGCPSDHPYLTEELPAPAKVTPLVAGISAEMVEASQAMYAGVSAANVAAYLQRMGS